MMDDPAIGAEGIEPTTSSASMITQKYKMACMLDLPE